jgi:CRP-like cAMP-binding protein
MKIRNLFKKIYSSKELELIEFLKQTTLFCNLTDKEIYKFIPFLHERAYKKREVVFFRDDPAQALYIIKKGKITVSLDMGADFEHISILSSPASVGDNALLTGSTRNFTSICESDTAVLLVIPSENMRDIFEAYPAIRLKMTNNLAVELNTMQKALFKYYRENRGFFEMKQVYELIKQE